MRSTRRTRSCYRPGRRSEGGRSSSRPAGAVAAWRGELDDATEMLEEAIELSRRLDLPDCEFDATSMLALIHAVRGELKRAARLANAACAFSACDRERWRASPHLVPALAALAICAFEWGDDEGGRELARGGSKGG